MSRRTKVLGIVSAGLILGPAFAGRSSAIPIISSPTGLVAPAATIDFSEVPLADDAPLSGQFAAFGVSFTDLFYNGCPFCFVTPPSGAKPDIGNFTDDSTLIFNAGGNIFFTTPVSGAAFQWASNVGSFTFSAYLGPTLLDSFTVNVNTSGLNGSSGWGFYGFDGITLDRIGIDSGAAFLIDNLEMGAAVPEPGTLLLVGSGLIGLSRLRRRLSC